jgi:hypothetical protein
MPWPQTVDYNCAIQDPQQCFTDADLRAGTVAEGMIPGLPLSYSGNFATVYKVTGQQGAWAVKCFTRKVENLKVRYREISAHLEGHRRRFAVDFQYLEEGIFVSGAWHPVVKMQWVEGFTLNEFLRDHCGNAAVLEQLCALWLRLAHDLREDRTAHGDLQHGNVLLVPGGSASSLLLRLVDYDGMWVPALAGLPPGEVGHANYQHPQRLRVGGYGPHIDRFSQLAIYAALRCLLAGGKPLWSAHDNGENLLFREADFLRPARSKLFAQLLALPDDNAVSLVLHLLLACQGPLEDVPLLSDLLAGAAVAPLSAEQRDHVADLMAAVPEPAGAAPPSIAERGRRSSPFPSRRDTELIPDVPPPGVTATLEASLAPAALPASERAAETAVLSGLRTGAIPLEDRLPGVPPLPEAKRREPPPPPPPIKPLRKAMIPSLLVHLASRSTAARWGAVALAAAGALVGVLALWLLWPDPKPPPPGPTLLARLLPPDPVVVRAGGETELTVRVDRETTDVTLKVRLDGLPHEVACAEATLPPGDGPASVSLKLRALEDAPARSGHAFVRLCHEGEVLSEHAVEVTVKAFVKPRLKDVEPIRLVLGRSLQVLVAVDDRGNTDPWTLHIEPLPLGIQQRPMTSPVPPGHAGVELVALADALETDRPLITTVSLRAYGLFADAKNTTISVEREKQELRIGLELPRNLVVRAGKTTNVPVELQRNGFGGEVRLELKDLPEGVTAEPVTVPAKAATAEVALKAAEAVKAAFRLQELRLVALVDGKEVGHVSGRFELEPEQAPVKPAAPAVEKPLPTEEVRIETCDGARLHGTLYPSPQKALKEQGPCVLMVPEVGRGSRKDAAWVRLAQRLQKDGCSVVTFDFRGCGENRSSEQLMNRFWVYQANRAVLLPWVKKGNGTQASLDASQFPPSYLPWLVQDIVAARNFLDLQHEEGRLNSQNLVVIAAGEGTALTALWLAAECFRHKTTFGLLTVPGPPESRDLMAVVWIDSQTTVGRQSVLPSLRLAQTALARARGLPKMLFVHDGSSAGASGRSKSMMKILNQRPESEKAITGAGRGGQAVLADPEGEKAVLDFLATVRKGHEMRAWDRRTYAASGFVWALSGKQSPAKRFLETVPLPLPLDQLGFPRLPAR